MKHRALLSAGVLILAFFFSCKNQIEQSSSVTFSLPGNAARAITAEADGNWILKISLSGGCEMEKTFEIQEDSVFKDLSFSFDDLPVGETVTVDVNIYCGNVRHYRTAKNKTLTLENGENTVDIVLVRDVSDGTITAESFAEKVSITAKYSADASTAYENTSFAPTSKIPYNNDTLTFSLSGLDDYNLGDDDFAWYLNGDTTLEGGSEISFIPYEQSGLNIDDSNTIVCYVTINETTYATSMNFTFSATRSAAVWFNGINATNSVGPYYSLKQLGDDKDTTVKESEIVSELSYSKRPFYCFDKNFNLWTAVSGDSGLVLTKYSMILSSGLYNTTGTSITNENITTTPIDMTYDATTEYFYILEGNENDGYTLHKTFVEDSEYTDATYSLSITDSEGNTVTPSQIAVCGDIIYVAGSDCNIYAGTGVGTSSNVTLTITFDSTATASLASAGLLNNYTETDADYLSITDLQIGDGLGNDTTSLYALVREYLVIDITADNKSLYSKGALVKIAISDTVSVTSYGWTINSSAIQQYNYGYSGTLYAPDSSSTEVEFYGPIHFAAVVPKKLVIIDSGISATGEIGKLNGMDSLVEFDIAESSLSRGASVNPMVKTTNASWFYE